MAGLLEATRDLVRPEEVGSAGCWSRARSATPRAAPAGLNSSVLRAEASAVTVAGPDGAVVLDAAV